MAIINQGQILVETEPVHAIRSLQGRVWKKILDRTELPDYERQHRVISTKLFAGRLLIHVYADERPDATFDPVDLDLEDVYFTTMAGLHCREAARSGAEAAS